MPETDDRRPLGVFGGTFDPLHFGHLRLAEEACDRLQLAAVRWIPAGQPALRGSPRVSAAQRLAMVRLATADNARFTVDCAEAAVSQASYTVPTLERLRRPEVCGAQRPLVLLLGADAFLRLPEWHRWQSLFALAHIAVAHRPGSPLAERSLPPALGDACRERFSTDAAQLSDAPAGRVVPFAMTPLAISATQVRALLAADESVRYLLPDALIAYIRAHHLYTEH